MNRTCETCGKPFEPGRQKAQKTCSPTCRDLRKRELVKERARVRRAKILGRDPNTGRCAKCGSETRRTHARGPVPKWCSPECRRSHDREAHRERRLAVLREMGRTCRVCGRWFSPGRQPQRDCSDICRQRNKRLASRARAYSLTSGQLQALLAAGCGICGSHDGLQVDHDHNCCPERWKSCGRCVRGVLCGGCNRAIGLLRDDPSLLIAAFEYLRGGDPHLLEQNQGRTA